MATASAERVLELLRIRATGDKPHQILLQTQIEAAFWQAATEEQKEEGEE